MEFKANSFDSPTSTPKPSKKTVKFRDRSCQTDSHILTKKKNTVSDLVLGPSPSGTPAKNHSTEYSTKISPNHEDITNKPYCCTESHQASSSPIVVSGTCMDILEIPCENIPVIQKDMDAMSINFETPYLSSHKRVQRKLSLPQIMILKKNSSQESDSPPDNVPSGSKKFFSGSSSSSSSSRFLSTLKKRKHALKRALSFQNSSTSSEEKATPVEAGSIERSEANDEPNTL